MNFILICIKVHITEDNIRCLYHPQRKDRYDNTKTEFLVPVNTNSYYYESHPSDSDSWRNNDAKGLEKSD
jgi:hypothetical protein